MLEEVRKAIILLIFVFRARFYEYQDGNRRIVFHGHSNDPEAVFKLSFVILHGNEYTIPILGYKRGLFAHFFHDERVVFFKHLIFFLNT